MIPLQPNRCLITVIFVMVLAAAPNAWAQPAPTDEAVREMIARWKDDPRGPFQAIRWFCPDGRVLIPTERCGEPAAVQHAILKNDAERLRTRHLYLGDILTGQDPEAFLDERDQFARPIQYMIERYLERVDNGWIRRRARFYRGAVQAEDEEAWGRRFLAWATSRDNLVRGRFFLARELVRDVPHGHWGVDASTIRGLAAEISDAYAPFLDLRVKIHGQPGPDDVERVESFARDHRMGMGAEATTRVRRLQSELTSYYKVSPVDEVRRAAKRLPPGAMQDALYQSADRIAHSPSDLSPLATQLLVLRDRILEAPAPERPALFDTSIMLESLIYRLAAEYPARTTAERLERAYLLAAGAAGAGWIEQWEWQEVEPSLRPPQDTLGIAAGDLRRRIEALRRVVEWGAGMASATFGREVARFEGFEPLARGFIDDRLRGSVLLHLGREIDRLGVALSTAVPGTNEVMGVEASERIRGMNAGFAEGILSVVDGSPDDVTFRPDRIYVLAKPPSEMKPVAGVLSVTEGNIVSHVQLLARNLGIPNAVIAPDHVAELAPYDSQRVFLAVSPGGIVRLIPSERMTAEERSLVATRSRGDERLRVPTDRLALDHLALTSLDDLRASDSGRLCGPKAANLGQLNSLFPDRVAPGFIVPFGVFRRHMDQSMPGSSISYWTFLQATFDEAQQLTSRGVAPDSVDLYTLSRLGELRDAIAVMPFDPAFLAALGTAFTSAFGTGLGGTAVFIRSDTNMEDLKDFTGAGLNQTVANVVSEADVLDAIRRVWASPYRERSYSWRQRYLLNPEDVYPSILVLQSVNVDFSGVMITTGIDSGDPADDTVAFNRGVGGAVDGQAAETWLLDDDGVDYLLAPAREPTFRTLPSTGGTRVGAAGFSEALLSPERRSALRQTAADLRRLLPGTPGIETTGPFDIELGFLDDQVRLFQVRPFVENRSASSAGYLLSLDAEIAASAHVSIPLDQP